MALIACCIAALDIRGCFKAEQVNDHTERKWHAFYEFTEENNVDIILLGNSHLYTGISPKNLSATLGVNSFVLGAPGTNVSDAYFVLEEALTRCQPSIVILETYCIKDFEQLHLSRGTLSDQFKSFAARKNVWAKLVSTPQLFSARNYLYAWSSTLRNHRFLFTDMQQIKRNIKRDLREKRHRDELYLGRFVSVGQSLEDSTLARYKTVGSPIDGKGYEMSDDARMFVEKIATLCRSKDIKLMFLTLPMYNKHIADYGVWKNRLSQVLSRHSDMWLDLQESKNYKGFTPSCFENTYKPNQHLTYQGSLIATYKLAGFLRKHQELRLPQRGQGKEWHELFYGDEGYFENYPPRAGDKNNKLIATNIRADSVVIEEVYFLRDGGNTRLLAKLPAGQKSADWTHTHNLRLTVRSLENGREREDGVEMFYDRFHLPENHMIFLQVLRNDVEIVDVVSQAFVDNRAAP